MAPEQTVLGARKRRFRVVWQHPESRRFSAVGDLVIDHEGPQIGRCAFSYRSDARTEPDFHPFLAFPEFGHRYVREGSLFPFFANRVMSARRPDYSQYVEALGLSAELADPVEILARSGGGRATDTVHVVPEPVPAPSGGTTRHFLASGVRHLDGASDRVAGLAHGARLELRDEPDNPENPRAVLLDADGGRPVGWVPNYLLDELHKAREEGDQVLVTVEKANSPDAPAHLRLLCRMDVSGSN